MLCHTTSHSPRDPLSSVRAETKERSRTDQDETHNTNCNPLDTAILKRQNDRPNNLTNVDDNYNDFPSLPSPYALIVPRLDVPTAPQHNNPLPVCADIYALFGALPELTLPLASPFLEGAIHFFAACQKQLCYDQGDGEARMES